jgi:hypothetical protein
VQSALKEIIKGIHDFTIQREVSNTIKLLTPHKFVPKLIGVGNNK